MKHIDNNNFGLEELTNEEAITINGGIVPPIPWGPIIDGICALLAGGLFGYALNEKRKENDIEYYGGELDPAVCEG